MSAERGSFDRGTAERGGRIKYADLQIRYSFIHLMAPPRFHLEKSLLVLRITDPRNEKWRLRCLPSANWCLCLAHLLSQMMLHNQISERLASILFYPRSCIMSLILSVRNTYQPAANNTTVVETTYAEGIYFKLWNCSIIDNQDTIILTRGNDH